MKQVQAAAVVEFKSRVDRIADFLKAQGYDVQHMHLMEGIARYEGSRDWRTYRALLATPPAPQAAPENLVDDEDENRCMFKHGEATDAQAEAMSEMLDEWDDEDSFEDILATLRNMSSDRTISAQAGYTHLTREQLADALENFARAREAEIADNSPSRVMSRAEQHSLSCLEYWGSLTFDEILEILDSEDPVRRKEIDVHPSLVDFSNKEISEIIRREYRWALSEAKDGNPSFAN